MVSGSEGKLDRKKTERKKKEIEKDRER